MNQQIKVHDNRDDRREVHELLELLPPAWRLEWLRWCCDACPGPMKMGVPPHHSGLALEVYYDAWFLCNQKRLDMDRALEVLVRLTRTKCPAKFRSKFKHRAWPTRDQRLALPPGVDAPECQIQC